jgi:tetratricopeptide (TPR) repeat protein
VRLTVSSWVLCCACLIAPSLARAQAPAPAQSAQSDQRFKNLKVLPANIGKDELTGIMRGFASALGVQCGFCHVGDNPQKMDFPSDDKEEKRSARVMMKMVRGINQDTLPQLDTMSENAEVTCYTCHRGAKQPPRRLSDVLFDTANERGVDAAMTQYQKMRDEFADTGRYDFRPQELTAAAFRLRAQKPDQALALLKATTALFPKSSEAAAMLGMALMDAGDKAGAETELNRALSLDPDNGFAKGALQRLKGGGGPPRP